MIPSNNGFLNQNFEIEEQPSRTYRMDLEGDSVRGFCDGLEAIKQGVFKILHTERFKHIIYSWNYGIETMDLYGEPITWVCPELERRIKEALSVDNRIKEVTDFEHDTSNKGIIHTRFTVHTVYGDFLTEKEVNV